MIEILFELVVQFVVEVIVQGGFELGFRGLVEPFRKDRRPNVWLGLIAYTCMGAISGVISIWLIPMHVIKHPILQYAHLAVTPIALGFAFEWLGRRRESKGKPKMLVDRFSYGFVFALTMGLIRFWLAQ